MKNRYNELFDRVNPPKTDDELLRAVIAEKNSGLAPETPEQSEPRRRVFKRPAVILAAAAVTVSAGVTAAGASVGWDFPKLFEGFYTNVLTDYYGYGDLNTENEEITADLSEMGIDLNHTFDLGIGSVTFTGAIADSSAVLVMYDITIDEEILEEYNPDNREMWAMLDLRGKPDGFFSGGLNLISKGSNSISRKGNTFSRALSYEFMDCLDKNDVLNISCESIRLSAAKLPSKEIMLENPVELSIPLDFMNTDRIEVSPNVEITHDDCRYLLEDVIITPLSTKWYVQPLDEINHLPLRSEPLIYRFKDGTEVKNYGITEGSSYDDGQERHHTILDKPINLSELVSVTIGDYTITI